MKKHTKLNHNSLLASTDVKLLYSAIKTYKCCSLSVSLPITDPSTVFGSARLWELHFDKHWVMKPNCLAGRKSSFLWLRVMRNSIHVVLHVCVEGTCKETAFLKKLSEVLFTHILSCKTGYPQHFWPQGGIHWLSTFKGQRNHFGEIINNAH